MANSIDSNADCTRLVVDGWLELELRNPEEALKVLSSALTLRAEWERLLLAQLEHNTARGESAQGVSRKTTEKLSEGLVRYLMYTEVLTEGSTTKTILKCKMSFSTNMQEKKVNVILSVLDIFDTYIVFYPLFSITVGCFLFP